MSEEKLFLNSYGEITYHFAKNDELTFYPNPRLNPIFLDLIQVEIKGEGNGTKLLQSFIEEMKKQNVDLIYA